MFLLPPIQEKGKKKTMTGQKSESSQCLVQGWGSLLDNLQVFSLGSCHDNSTSSGVYQCD